MSRPLTPLAILLATMRQKWTDGDRGGATVLARVAVPYVHARRTSLAKAVKLPTEAHYLTDEELALQLAAAAGGAEHSQCDPDEPGGVV